MSATQEDLTLHHPTEHAAKAASSRPVAYGAGAIGGLAMTLIFALARLLGLTPLNLEMNLGAMFTRRVGVGTWILGLVIHLLVSAVIAQAYATAFRRIGSSGWKMGAGFGVIHWIAGGFFLGLTPYFHPVIPGLLPVPGYFGAIMGLGTVDCFLITHLIYGAIVGELYRPVAVEREVEVSEERAA